LSYASDGGVNAQGMADGEGRNRSIRGFNGASAIGDWLFIEGVGCSGWTRTSTGPLNRREDYYYPTEQ
jgi:hypothetical protein